MPLLVPATLLAFHFALQAPAAAPGEDPFDTALELIRHQRVQFAEVGAVSHMRTALSGGPEAPPPEVGVKSGYHYRFRNGVYTAVPVEHGLSGIHGFCSDASDRVCYTAKSTEPPAVGSRCAPSCRDLPQDWVKRLLPAPALSAGQKAALAAALDSDPRFRGQPALAETVRALLAAASPAAGAAEGRAHAGAVYTLAFTPDGGALITGSNDTSQAILWSVSSRQPLGTLTGCDGLYKALVTPDGALAVTSCFGSVKLWSLPDWSAVATFDGFRTSMIDLAVDKAGRTLAAAAEGGVTVWRLPGRQSIASIRTAPPGEAGLASLGALTPDGTRLVSSGFGQPFQVWAVPEGTRVSALKDAPLADVTDLAISPDGRTLAAGSGNGTVALWTLPDGRAISRRKEHGFPVNALAFSADGQWLVSASSDHAVKIWELPAVTVRHTLRGHANEVFSVAVSSAGLIASGDRDGVVLLWDLATGAAKGRLVGPGQR